MAHHLRRPPGVDPRAFLAQVPEGLRDIVAAVREVVLRSATGVEETVLWGGLSYHRPAVGGRVKGAVCQITVKRGLVLLEFIHGVRLRDPQGLLRGDLVSKRRVPIRTVADAARPGVAALIREASSLDPESWA